MRLAQDCGIVVFSVDVPDGRSPQSAMDRSGSRRLIEHAVNLFDEYELPVTWGFDPLRSTELLDSVFASRQDHEFALIGDSSWIGCEKAARITPSQLRRRIESAAVVNAPISSVLLRDSVLPPELGPLARHGIRAVRGQIRQSTSIPTLNAPHRLRFGIWFEPSDVVLPQIHHWPHLLSGSSVNRAIRRVRRLTKDCGSTHIAIDAPALVEKDSFSTQKLDHVLRAVAGFRDRGALAVLTLAASARHHSKNRKTNPARSVLRPAA